MTLNIQIAPGWRLLSDKYNFILATEEGDRLTYVGFYQTFEGAFQGFIRKKIKGFDSTSLQGLQNSIKALENSCHKLLHSSKIELEKQKEEADE